MLEELSNDFKAFANVKIQSGFRYKQFQSSTFILKIFTLHGEWVDWNRMRFNLGKFLYLYEKINFCLILGWVPDIISVVSVFLFGWRVNFCLMWKKITFLSLVFPWMQKGYYWLTGLIVILLSYIESPNWKEKREHKITKKKKVDFFLPLLATWYICWNWQ